MKQKWFRSVFPSQEGEEVVALKVLEVTLLFHPGAIFVIENLDYESSREYYLTVEAADGGTPSLSDVATVSINVTDINDNSPVFSQDTYTAVISEDALLEQSVITVCIFSPTVFFFWIFAGNFRGINPVFVVALLENNGKMWKCLSYPNRLLTLLQITAV